MCNMENKKKSFTESQKGAIVLVESKKAKNQDKTHAETLELIKVISLLVVVIIIIILAIFWH